ncbi:hypothetical protein C4573_02270 [Candidatus Woesearchaeota archaeon]|nr:MAG: hypothetical protein C4573_02270 [Candidatus Woesearchaeota archaeon]
MGLVKDYYEGVTFSDEPVSALDVLRWSPLHNPLREALKKYDAQLPVYAKTSHGDTSCHSNVKAWGLPDDIHATATSRTLVDVHDKTLEVTLVADFRRFLDGKYTYPGIAYFFIDKWYDKFQNERNEREQSKDKIVVCPHVPSLANLLIFKLSLGHDTQGIYELTTINISDVWTPESYRKRPNDFTDKLEKVIGDTLMEQSFRPSAVQPADIDRMFFLYERSQDGGTLKLPYPIITPIRVDLALTLAANLAKKIETLAEFPAAH